MLHLIFGPTSFFLDRKQIVAKNWGTPVEGETTEGAMEAD
jgi:hypothetical protein